MAVTTAYRDAWQAVRPDIDRWLKLARGTYDIRAVHLFADIQAKVGDTIREALDAEGLSAFDRERVVLDTLRRFRQAAALTGTPATDDIIRDQMQRAMGVGAARASTTVTTLDLQRQRAELLSGFTEAGASNWTWKARLDPKTCAYCLSMHGRSFPIGTQMLSHPNCRCMPVPDAIPQSGWGWLRQQAREVQDRILHPLVARAWRQGRLTPEVIVDMTKRRRRPLRDLVPWLRRNTRFPAYRRRR